MLYFRDAVTVAVTAPGVYTGHPGHPHDSAQQPGMDAVARGDSRGHGALCAYSPDEAA